MSGDLNPVPVYTGKTAGFYGVSIILIYREWQDEPFAVTAESVRDAFPDHLHLWAFIKAKAVPARVRSEDESVRTSWVIDLKDFYKFAAQHPSPQMDRFRDWLANVTDAVQRTGGYHDPAAGFEAFVPPELANDPVANMAAMIIKSRRDMAAIQAQVGELRDDVKRDIDDIRGQLGNGPSHWTVSAWLDLHGVKATTEVSADEGRELRKICLSRGFIIPKKKVCMGSQFSARRWPMEAIRIWWPEFCRRHNIPLTWKNAG